MKVDFIHKVQHIGIPAHNLEISIPFYERLGFENVMESPFEFDGGYGTCVMMKNHEVIVELYQMPEKQLSEIKQRKNGHVDHFAIDVSDVDSAFDTLKKAGFEVDRRRITFETDPKEVGEYLVNLNLHKEVKVQVAFEVVAE